MALANFDGESLAIQMTIMGISMVIFPGPTHPGPANKF